MKQDILIIGYIPVYNHQGQDLHSALNSTERTTTLIQFGISSNTKQRIIGVPYKQSRTFGSFSVMLNVWRLFVRSIFIKHSIVIGIGNASVYACSMIKFIRRSKFIYYALELDETKKLHFLIRYFCDGIINVEENRQKFLDQLLGVKLKSIIVYNMPRKIDVSSIQPKMRDYLITEHNIPYDSKIVIYAGSHQKYAQLDKIIEWFQYLPENIKLVLMVNYLPEKLVENKKQNIIIIPFQSQDSFFSWLIDADVALLPYEDETNLNVQLCSPQKLFDCLAVGIPFLGSKKPLIEKIVKETGMGMTIDFTKKTDFLNSIMAILNRDKNEYKRKSLKAHLKYNYDYYKPDIVSFLDSF